MFRSESLEELNEFARREYGSYFLGCELEKRRMYPHPPDSLVCKFDVDLRTEYLDAFFDDFASRLDDIERDVGRVLNVKILRV